MPLLLTPPSPHPYNLRMATSNPHDTSAHHHPGGNNPNGNPNWTPGMPAPPYCWQPGQSGNPDTPALSPAELRAFLDLLDDAYPPTQAARLLGHRRQTFRDLCNRDPSFAAAVMEARSEGRADWYEARLRGRASGEEKGDTLATIIGAKMTGRFIEPQYQHLLVSVDDPVKKLLAQLGQLAGQHLAAAVTVEPAPVTVEGQVREMLGPGEQETESSL